MRVRWTGVRPEWSIGQTGQILFSGPRCLIKHMSSTHQIEQFIQLMQNRELIINKYCYSETDITLSYYVGNVHSVM